MALTTSDEIQKQLTVIFSFKGQLELEVGSIIGIGKLSTQHTEALVSQTMQFLHAYNAMLRDYAGCELFSIEFELENLDRSKHQLKIMPKSMLFIPGLYKDCQTLLLLLSNEMSLLDNQKAKDSLNDIGMLFYEVEEVAQRPDLTSPQKREILANFARRFALKLQGQALEGKWNRRLVGLKTEIEEENTTEYLSVHIKKDLRWDRGKEILPKTPKFSSPRLNWPEDFQFDFMKHQILPSTANVICQNTFRLATDLLNIANTGTIEDVQEQIFVAFLNGYYDYSQENPLKLPITFDNFTHQFETYSESLNSIIESFDEKSMSFCKGGTVGKLSDQIDSCLSCFDQGQDYISKGIYRLALIVKNELFHFQFQNRDKVRSSEFQTTISYIKESAKIVIKHMKTTLSKYIQNLLLNVHSQNLMKTILAEFETQRKPVMALGIKYLEKFAYYLKNQIEFLNNLDESSMTGEKNIDYGIIPIKFARTQKEIFKYFIEIANSLINPFISEVLIDIEDLIGFVDIMMQDVPEAKSHIDKLKKFEREIDFLWGLILRSSSINRFLKDFPESDVLDPAQFASRFIEFLRKRLGGFQTSWQAHVFHWIEKFGFDFQQKYLEDKEKKKPWSRSKLISEFIEYIDKKVEEETSLDGFKGPLKAYVDLQAMNIQNRFVAEIFNSYLMSLDIIDQFPDFIKQTYAKVIQSLPNSNEISDVSIILGEIPKFEEIIIGNKQSYQDLMLNSLNRPESLNKSIQQRLVDSFARSSYYNYVLSYEMKYFSKLLAKPTHIILKNLDNASFESKTLLQQIDFKYWDKFMKMFIASNYLAVKPRYGSGGK